MGTFKWPLRIAGMDGKQEREVEATVDTGAAYTTLPASLLRALGIEPMDRGTFLYVVAWLVSNTRETWKSKWGVG